MILVILTIFVSMAATRLAAKDDFGMAREDNRRYGGFTETIEQHLKHLAEGKFNCQYSRAHNRHEMSKNYIRNKTVTCNDGTPSGYYIRRSVVSAKWLVFLDGGWFCHDMTSCKTRWMNTPSLMTSKYWPPTKQGFGIMSTNQAENPLFHDANIVYVPYCSSDAWSGKRHPRVKGDFAFLGSLILENVIRDLVYSYGLADATKMFLAGSSAGGSGVIINLDRIAGLMSSLAPRVEVRGIVDSGWFLDNQQYKKTGCQHIHSCAPTESIQRGMQLWGGVLPDSCIKQYPSHEVWRCYFGYRVYPTLKTPVFVIQHLFDEAQLTVDNVGTAVTKEQWQYIHDIGQDMRRTLSNVSAIFAPACLSHILLTRGEWLTVRIGGVTLPEAIACWQDGQHERNLYSRKSNERSNIALAERLITGLGPRHPREEKLQADSPRQSKNRVRLQRQRDRKRRAKKKERERKRQEKKEQRQQQRKERKALELLPNSKRNGKPRQEEGNLSPKRDNSLENGRMSQKQLRRSHRNLYLDPEPNFDFDISNTRTLRSGDARPRHGLVLANAKPKRRHSKTSTLESNKKPTSRAHSRARHARDRSDRPKRALVFDEHDVHHMQAHDNRCSHHRIDHCEWPQCNFSCPKIYHPFTGAEMDFMDLFMQFGLDTSGIADSLDLEDEDVRNNQDLLLSLLFNSGK